RGRTRSVGGDEGKAVASGFFIDEIVDVALAIDRDLPGAVAGDRGISHQPEQRVQLLGLGMGVFDEFEAVGPHRIGGRYRRRRRVMREWTHGESPASGCSVFYLGANCVQNSRHVAINMHVPFTDSSWRCNFDRTANIATATCRRMRRRPASAEPKGGQSEACPPIVRRWARRKRAFGLPTLPVCITPPAGWCPRLRRSRRGSRRAGTSRA